jgi:RecA-family ATPase
LTGVTSNGKPLFEQTTPPAETPTIIDAGLWEGQPVQPRLYRWNGWIAARQVTYLGGAGASGKSLFCQQLATCAALGLPFLGIQTICGVSLHVTCEDDLGELHRRQNAICARLRVSLSTLRQRLGFACLTGMVGNELVTFDRQGVMALTSMFEWLLQAIHSIGAKLVILDNVAHFFSGDENNRHHVAPFIGALNRLAAQTGAAIILIGHPAKSGNGYSGSTAWENQVRTRLFLQVSQEPNGFIPDRDARTLTRAKSNYGRGGETLNFRWHNDAFLLSAELGDDASAAIAANAQAANDDQIFLACLAERLRQRRAVSDRRSPTFAPTVFAKMADSERIGKARLEAAMDRLFRAGKIERAVLWRDTGKARDIAGLRPVAPDPQTVPPDGAPTLLPDTPDQLTQTPSNTHSISKEIDGAACWQARRSEGEGGAPMT